eukprot:106405-Karenia_brevis.AAC.1
MTDVQKKVPKIILQHLDTRFNDYKKLVKQDTEGIAWFQKKKNLELLKQGKTPTVVVVKSNVQYHKEQEAYSTEQQNADKQAKVDNFHRQTKASRDWLQQQQSLIATA